MSRNVRNLAASRVVGALRPPIAGQVDYFDATLKGFGIRISAAGRRTWFVMYRDQDGRRERLTLGTYPNLAVKDARLNAGEVLQAIAKGGNPAKEKREGKTADTFVDLAVGYIRHYAQGDDLARWLDGKAICEVNPGFEMRGRELVVPKGYPVENLAKTRRAIVDYLKSSDAPPAAHKRSWAKDQAIIDRDLLPEWRHRKADSITRADVNRLLDKIVERGAPIQANRTLEIVRKMYSWAIGASRVALDSNPCSEVKKRGKETPKNRHLSAEEIKVLWPMRGSEDNPAKINEATRVAIRLILVTGQRPGEVLGMRWGEIEGDWQSSNEPTWTIPSERAKNGRAHRVPLSPLAVVLLTLAKARANESPFVFPSPRGTGPMLVSSLSHALVRSHHFGIAPFTCHDLRRTAATHLEGPHCGVPRFIVARVLNHADMSITGRHYSQYQHDVEKRDALNAWARRLGDIIEGRPTTSTVVELYGAAER